MPEDTATAEPPTDTVTDQPAAPDVVSDQPPAAPEGPYSGYVNPDGTFRENWADSAPEDLQEYSGTIAKYKSLPEVAKALKHAQSRIGQDSVVVPGEGADETTIAEFRRKVGAPSDVAEYKLNEAPEGWPEGVPWSEDKGSKVAEILNKYHVPAAAAQELAGIEKEFASALGEQQAQLDREYAEKIDTTLKEEWGEQYDLKVAAAAKAANVFGLDLANPEEDPAKEALAWAKVYDVLKEDASALKALQITPDSLSIMGGNPKAQAMDIMTNPRNPKYQSYRDGDDATRKEVLALLERAG